MSESQNPYILEVQELEKGYHVSASSGELVYPVLKKISFQVERGEFVGIMGRSGCGKTTLLKTLGMLQRPDQGKVLYDGVSTRTLYGDALAKIRRTEMAFIFQDFRLMDSLSVRENIMLPLILNEDDRKESLSAVLRMAEKFGIQKLLDKKPYELSGGEKQRAAICRAMVIDPRLVLADEPTGNLDSNSSRIVIESLAEMNQKLGKTVLLVTHDPGVASYCKRILFLKDGCILDDIQRDGNDRETFYREILGRMVDL